MFWWHWAKTLPSGDQSFRALVRERAEWDRVEWGISRRTYLVSGCFIRKALADVIGPNGSEYSSPSGLLHALHQAVAILAHIWRAGDSRWSRRFLGLLFIHLLQFNNLTF
jgi:hypothetical protein